MSMVKKADYYYGAFLSSLLNSAGKKPSLFERSENDSRRIYVVNTENSSNPYVIFAKYASKGRSNDKGSCSWTFVFSDNEISRLTDLSKDRYAVRIALICAEEDLRGGEIALLTFGELDDCLGLTLGTAGSRSVVVKRMERKHGLCLYGSGRAEQVDGRDNTLTIRRDAMNSL